MAPSPQQLVLIAQARRRRAEAEGQGGSPFAPKPSARSAAGFEANPVVSSLAQTVTPREDPYKRTERLQREKQADPGRASVSAGMDLQHVERNGLLSPRGPADTDISKGLVMSPVHLQRGAVGAVESTANLPSDIVNSAAQASAAPVSTDMSLRNVNRMPQLQAREGQPAQTVKPVPRFDFSAAKIPVPAGMESVTGNLEEGLAQFLVGRVGLGKLASGGNAFAQLGKDVATTGAAFDANSGRLSDIIDPNAIPEGPLRDYASWLRTQPEDSPIVGRFKNMLEDLTLSGPMLAPQAAVRGVQAVDEALPARPRAPVAPAPAPAPAAQPSPVVTAVPPTAPRATQAGPASAGQQGGAAQPTLNATLVQPPAGASAISVAKHDARNVYRMMKAAGVPANDIKPLFADLLQQYQGLNDSRMRLALFAREYLPQRLSKPVADAVAAQFDAFGFQQLTNPGPGAGVMRNSIDEVRNSQKAYLEGEFDRAFGKDDIVTTTGKLKKLKSDNAEAIYRTQIARQQRNLDNSAASAEQVAARDALLQTMGREDFFKKLPAELDFAAKNDGYGSLWEYVHQKPLESAHWLQSKLGFMERGQGENAGLYRQMRRMVLNSLEEAVPGYRGARMQHGDAVGQQLAKTLGQELRAAAGDRIKVADLAERVAELPNSQKKVAALSVKEALKNEFRKTKGASRIDPATGDPIDEQVAVITQMQKDGMLDALETVFPGSTKGARATAAIRKVMRENEGLPSYRSDTAANQKKQAGAVEAIRSPANKLMRGVADKTGYVFTVPLDVGAMAVGAPPVFTASKVVGDLATWASKPNPRHSASTAALLYGTPPPNVNGLLPPARPARAPAPRTPKAALPPPSQEALDDLLRQYDAIDPGQDPTGAERLRKQITAMQKKLGNAPINGLTSPTPSGSPVKMGFGSEVAVGGAGATAGYNNPIDWNDDGEITDDERIKSALAVGLPAAGGARLLKGITAKGAQGANQLTFGGINAKTADKAALAKAQSLEAQGVDRDTIWRETGWGKGVDGKWRFEIDDSGARLKPEYEALRRRGQKDMTNHGAIRPMGEVLDHPKYFEAYPEAAADQFASGRLPHGTLGAAGMDDAGRATIAVAPVDRRRKFVGPAPDRERSTTLHENEHLVQKREDFATGGEVEQIAKHPELEKARAAQFKVWEEDEQARWLNNMASDADWYRANGKGRVDPKGYFSDTTFKIDHEKALRRFLPHAFEDPAAYDEQMKRFGRAIELWNQRPLTTSQVAGLREEIAQKMVAAQKAVDDAYDLKEAEAFDSYRSLAGEVEARNVQARRYMSPEQRRQTPPWQTQDVPDDQQIIRYGSGRQESRPPSGSGGKPPETQTFSTSSGRRYAVDFDDYGSGSAGVRIRRERGPLRPFYSDYRSDGKASLKESNEALDGAMRVIADDLEKDGRNRYIISGFDEQRGRVFRMLAERAKIPEGYRVFASNDGVVIERVSPEKPSVSSAGNPDRLSGKPPGGKSEGFDPSAVYYHGSPAKFEHPNGPIYLTKSEGLARSYSKQQRSYGEKITPTVYSFQVRPNNVYEMSSRTLPLESKNVSQLGLTPSDVEKLKAAGFDAVADKELPNELFVIDPSTIRRAEKSSSGKPPGEGGGDTAPKTPPGLERAGNGLTTPKPPERVAADNANGLKGPPKAKAFAPRVARELGRAKALPLEERSAIIANASKSPVERLPVIDATERSPNVFAMARPFQGRNGLDTSIAAAREKAGVVPPPVNLAPLMDAAQTAKANMVKARRDHNTIFNKTVTRDNRDALRAAALERATTAEDVYAAAMRELESGKQAVSDRPRLAEMAARRLSEIDAALRQTPASMPGRKPIVNRPGGQRGEPTRGSRMEADEINRLLFTPEGAETLAKILTGEITPKPGTAWHEVLYYVRQNPVLAAGALTGATGAAAGYAAIANDQDKRVQERREARMPSLDPLNPAYAEDPMKNSTDYRRVVEVQSNLARIGFRDIGKPDGIMLRQDGRETMTQKAVKRVQEANGLPVTGLLDDETIDVISELARGQSQPRREPATAN